MPSSRLHCIHAAGLTPSSLSPLTRRLSTVGAFTATHGKQSQLGGASHTLHPSSQFPPRTAALLAHVHTAHWHRHAGALHGTHHVATCRRVPSAPHTHACMQTDTHARTRMHACMHTATLRSDSPLKRVRSASFLRTLSPTVTAAPATGCTVSSTTRPYNRHSAGLPGCLMRRSAPQAHVYPSSSVRKELRGSHHSRAPTDVCRGGLQMWPSRRGGLQMRPSSSLPNTQKQEGRAVRVYSNIMLLPW